MLSDAKIKVPIHRLVMVVLLYNKNGLMLVFHGGLKDWAPFDVKFII